MSVNARQFYADLFTQKLVASLKDSTERKFDFPSPPFHTDQLFISLQPVLFNPTGSESAPFQVLDANGYAITLQVLDSTGATTLAGPVTVWSLDGTSKYAAVNLNTVAMLAAFGVGVTQVNAILEINFTGANDIITIQQSFSIKRRYGTAGAPAATTNVRYLTDADLALLVKYSGNPNGCVIELPSQSGLKKRILYTDDDGVFQTDPES